MMRMKILQILHVLQFQIFSIPKFIYVCVYIYISKTDQRLEKEKGTYVVEWKSFNIEKCTFLTQTIDQWMMIRPSLYILLFFHLVQFPHCLFWLIRGREIITLIDWKATIYIHELTQTDLSPSNPLNLCNPCLYYLSTSN